MSTDAVVYPRAATKHSRSDWAGCIFFLMLGTFLIVRTPRDAWMVLPTVVFDVLVSISFLIRRPARRTDSSWTAGLAAYLGTFLVPAYVNIATRVSPDQVSPTSLHVTKIAGIVWAIGLAFEIWTVWHLRFSFSIVPQARVLQTAGPYQFVRHPIYFAYIIMDIAYWMAHMHLVLGVVVMAWLAITLVRITYEERVLRQTFPQYEAYAMKVGRLWPLAGN